MLPALIIFLLTYLLMLPCRSTGLLPRWAGPLCFWLWARRACGTLP